MCASKRRRLSLILGLLAVQYYRLALALALGPAYTVLRWPETIQIDELRIQRSAWFHRDISMLWSEIESIRLGRSGDSVVLRSRNGDRIAISASQVGSVVSRDHEPDRNSVPQVGDLRVKQTASFLRSLPCTTFNTQTPESI
jgi:hypothetical protein